MLPVMLLPALLSDAELYAAPLAALSDLADPVVVTMADPDLARAAALVLDLAPARFALVWTSAGGAKAAAAQYTELLVLCAVVAALVVPLYYYRSRIVLWLRRLV
jgi:hypothetical protein